MVNPGPVSEELRDLTRREIEAPMADQGSTLTPGNPLTGNESASFAFGTISLDTESFITIGKGEPYVPVSDVIIPSPLPSWELPGTNPNIQVGSNGGLQYKYPYQAYVLFGDSPLITSIGDVAQPDFRSTDTIVIDTSVPLMKGTGLAGNVISVFHNGTPIGSTTVLPDGTWNFDTPALASGRHDFSVSSISADGDGVRESNHLDVRVVSDLSLAPTTVATITSALDEFIDPAGNHHDNVIQNGGKTFDTSPKLLGTLDAALNAGETLVVYRDGVKLGLADVSGLGWSFQDTGVATGEHTYTARVESATGVQGAEAANFGLVEAVPGSLDQFPMLLTDNFLIFDTRGISRMTSDGKPMSFDLLEGVKKLEADGATVKSYTDKDGFISIEVDWMSYLKAHPDSYAAFDFVAHRHIDNDKGGLDLYDLVGTPLFTPFGNMLDTWIPMPAVIDGRLQPATPPAATFITGIYDVYTDESGNPVQSLIPDGGSTANATHKIVLTFSEPLQQGWTPDSWALYRDGVRVWPSVDHKLEAGYDQATNTGWIIDTDVSLGSHVYTAHVFRKYGDQGAWSDSYHIVETSPASLAVATITSALDEFADPSGHLHQTVIENGGKTLDTSPKLIGTLSTTLQDGEVLTVFRDGTRLGRADVSERDWSFQDADVSAGNHAYTVRVESASGAAGAVSPEFSLVEVASGGTDKFPLLVTEHYLVLDIRGLNLHPTSGAQLSFDLMETVNGLNKLGLDAKINATTDGYISIEVDWMAYAESHPNERIDFVSRIHIDNDKGSLNYYQGINVPAFGSLLKSLGTWIPTNFMADGPEWQSATPAPATAITGIYDSYTDSDGQSHLALVPAGGASGESMHRIEGTLSDPIRMGSDWVVIYHDGVQLSAHANVFELGKTYSSSTWWFVDTDVPPGSHVYTARVERAYGEQGDWSGSYSIVGADSAAPIVETSPARMMLTDGALLLDVQSLTPAKDGSSVAGMGLAAELTIGGEQVASLPAVSDKNGLISFDADWNALAAAHPGATLTISAHTGPNDSIEVLDKHTLTALLGQTDRWVSMTSTGESAAFFDASDRGVHIHGNANLDTISIANDHQVLDLTSLTGKTIGSTIMGIEKIDLGGQHNTLKIAMIDVLNLGETDLFRVDGKQQLMVNGKVGDSVNLSNTRVAGIADGEWEQQAETKIGGVTYDVYEHSTAHVELIVQQGVQLTIH
jgi:hypothetical protein